MAAAFLVIGLSQWVFASDVDPREIAIDLAVGGMEEGSQPLSPESGADQIPGSNLSPVMDANVTASAASPNISVGQQEPVSEPTGGDGGGTPSVDTDVTVTPDAGGGILDVDTTATGPSDTDTAIGANLDDTSGALEGSATLETGPSEEGVTEPAATPTDERSIIEADASVDTTGGTPTVDANVSLDTSAEGGLVDADTTTTADVVDQELTSDAGLQIDVGDSTTLLESALGNEIGTSPAPAAAEADAGLEADVEGTVSGDDVSADPADGLSVGL